MSRLTLAQLKLFKALLVVGVVLLAGCNSASERAVSAPVAVSAEAGASAWDCDRTGSGQWRCQPPAPEAAAGEGGSVPGGNAVPDAAAPGITSGLKP